MSKFYGLQGLQGYLLCIVRLRQVKEVTDMIHTQKYMYMSKFSRLQGLQGYLLCIVRLRQVTMVTKIGHRQRNKAMSKFYRLHTRVMWLLAIHFEAMIGYRGNRHYSHANNKVMSKFIGYKGYEQWHS